MTHIQIPLKYRHTCVNIINATALYTCICQCHHILTDVIDAIPYTSYSCHQYHQTLYRYHYTSIINNTLCGHWYHCTLCMHLFLMPSHHKLISLMPSYLMQTPLMPLCLCGYHPCHSPLYMHLSSIPSRLKHILMLPYLIQMQLIPPHVLHIIGIFMVILHFFNYIF